MSREFFQQIEGEPKGQWWPLPETIAQLSFDSQGLIPVIAQQFDTGQVLMMAWMNQAALEQTLATGQVTYWSRSRQAFWVKGESSGNTQTLKELRIDCDGDALLCLVDQTGGACHTQRSNCFYFSINVQQQRVIINEDPPNP